MKITDKIVTSVTQPQHTNVLWHNPETGELKIFGNSGWEVIGGQTINGILEEVKSIKEELEDIKERLDALEAG